MNALQRTLALLPLIGLLTASSGAASGFGVNAHIPSDALADRIEAADIEWVRIDFLWSIVEPERDRYDWTVYDALIDRLESRGLRIYAGMGATPAWATSGSPFSGVPDDPDEWRELCYLAATRYAGRIDAWGPWNEPNLERFWEGSRREYIDLILMPAIDSIRLADPSALIGAPDLAHLNSGHWDDWLDQVVSQTRDRIDVVTHHVYPSDGRAWEVTYDLETGGLLPWDPPSVEEVLEDGGWENRPFWLTETGVESDRWGESRQASFVSNLLDEWFSPVRGRRNWVDRVFFYEMADAASPSPYSFGLLDGPPDLEPKLAYTAYADFVGGAQVDDAALLAATIPRYFEPGMVVDAELRFSNTGTKDWGPEEMTRLVVEIDSPGWLVDIEQLGADAVVSPDESHTFTVTITAPGVPTKDIGELPHLFGRLERAGSWWFGDAVYRKVEVVADKPPSITADPAGLVLARGATGQLRVEAAGAEPLSYRWLRNGVPLTDGEGFAGTDTPTLTVRAFPDRAAAFYQCRVTNDVGEIVSGAAAVSLGQPGPRTGGGRLRPIVIGPAAPPGETLPRLTGPGAGQRPSSVGSGPDAPNQDE